MDDLWRLSLYELTYYVALIIGIGLIAVTIYRAVKKKGIVKKHVVMAVLSLVIVFICQIPSIAAVLFFVKVPMISMVILVILCAFNVFIFKTKLGQDFRTVGQSGVVANASGINVNKTRIKAIIISTVLAAWGQIIFLQNIGTLNTYGSHEQVGMFAIAAILIGGASVSKATNKQALLGVILFHTLFVVSPTAGKNLFNNAQIGEYFRVFVAYGVICVSLALYAWKKIVEDKRDLKM
ncbi:hypothetical protein SDC9_170022 [bioreactor metagenome]|uniref:Uncharacterized protein n=1 Tax=bioreactor metagenome TaxID=1076179 RepID=A0A645GA10_9ZZZZ